MLCHVRSVVAGFNLHSESCWKRCIIKLYCTYSVGRLIWTKGQFCKQELTTSLSTSQRYFELIVLVHSIPSVSRQTWHPVITFCPSGNTVMSPVRMEHKFDSLRERWDKRKSIKWLLTKI